MHYMFIYQRYGLTSAEYSSRYARMCSKAKTILVQRYREEYAKHYKELLVKPNFSSAQARARTRLVHAHSTEYHLIMDSLRAKYLGGVSD